MDCILYALGLFTIAVYSQCDINITQTPWGPATRIPDNDSNGIQFEITAPAQPSGCVVESVSITLAATHALVQDLHFSLDGFEFFGDQSCGTSLYVTVTDASATPYGCPNGADDVQPISPFAEEFGGDVLDVDTIWTLSVYDDALAGEGTLDSWALCITTYCHTTTAMATSTTTAMAISTTTTMVTSSDSSSESAESADSSDDANNALFAGNQEMDNNNNELPEYGTYSLSLSFSDFALVNIWLLICVVIICLFVCCFYHKNKTNCY